LPGRPTFPAATTFPAEPAEAPIPVAATPPRVETGNLVQDHLAALRAAPPNSYVIDGRVGEGLDVEAIKSARIFSMKLEKPGAADALVAAGGFKPERVKLLTGEKATRDAILSSLKSMADPTENPVRGLAVVYFAGLTAPGADGKTLVPYGEGAGLSARDLATALGPLDNQEALFLGDCGRLATARAEGVWLENNDFLTILERAGWAAMASADPLLDERDGEEGSLFAGAVAAGLKGAGGGDGWVELDELYRFVFARLREHVKKQSLAPQVPLWRGEILGRIPLSVNRP